MEPVESPIRYLPFTSVFLPAQDAQPPQDLQFPLHPAQPTGFPAFLFLYPL